MDAKHFESRLETRDNTLIFTTDGQQLTLFVEGDDGQGTYAHLTPEKVHELKALLVNWERLYFNGAFRMTNAPYPEGAHLAQHTQGC